jgi:DNA-directed RNA polymerase specialized sigma24 family protein
VGLPNTNARDRRSAVLAPVIAAIEELVAERVAEELAVRDEAPAATWLTLDQAAARLGCSRDAVRMRAKRGRLQTRPSMPAALRRGRVGRGARMTAYAAFVRVRSVFAHG